MTQFALSKGQDWKLVNPQQDIRGWPVKTEDGRNIGEIRDLIIDSDTNRVEAVELSDGKKYPASEVAVGDGEAVLRRDAVTRASGGYDETEAQPSGRAFEHYEPAFREHHVSHHKDKEIPYERFVPAYRHGYDYAVHKDYRGRNYEDLEPDMRSAYNERHGENAFRDVRHAIRHGFDHVRSKGLGEGGRRKDMNRKI